METEVRRHLQRAGHRVGGDAALVTALADAAAAAGLPARDLADRYDAYLLNRGIEGGKLSATVVDGFVAQLQRDAARGAVGGAVGGSGGGLFGGGAAGGSSPAGGVAANAVPASKWAARSWEELPDNFAGAAPSNKDQHWPRPPSSSGAGGQQQQQQQHNRAAGAPPGSPLASAHGRGGLVAAAMTPGGPAAAARDASASPLPPQTAFKQRANAGQVVSALNAGAPGGAKKEEGEADQQDEGGLPGLAAAAAASRRRYQRLLRDHKARQQQGDEQQQQRHNQDGSADEERAAAAATAVVLSAPAAAGDPHASSSSPSSSSQLLPARGHRYMMERIEDKVAALDARIDAFERALRAALRSAGRAELAGAELAPVGAPHIDDGDAEGGGLFVGRVVSEAASGGGGAASAALPPLNAASLLLEGGVASSDGARARLVLTPAATAGAPVRLFPGQVVGVRGFSPAGHTIFARQVYTHVPPPPAAAGGRAAAAAAAAAAAGGAAAGAAAPSAPKQEVEAAADATAAAPMDLDAMVAAARPGDGKEQAEQQPKQQQDEEEQEQKTRHAAAAAAAAAAKKALAVLAPSLSIVAAAGPFTCSDDLSYEPLTALLDALRPNPPDLLLLLGPFVDAEHPRVSNGLCPCPLDALLSEGVAGRLASWRASLPEPHRSAMRVALVPSVRDAPAHPTFPQPPLDLPGAAPLAAAAAAAAGGAQQQQQQPPPDALVALQNPCTFVVSPPSASGATASNNNSGSKSGGSKSSASASAAAAAGVVVAATSQDVLRHLAGSELAVGAGGPGSVDRLSALASHLLGQRHLYPLFPAHASACLDTSRDALLRLPPGGAGGGARPDLLLLPSDLAPFARRVSPTGPGGCGGVRPGAAPPGDDVLCVNPGRLAKGAGGGTYARIVVVGGGGGDNTAAATAASLPLADRARVEIVRV